jgi:Peptidase A4 family
MHGRPHSLRSRALLACVPVLGLTMLASAGAASAARAPVNTRADVRAILEHMLAGWHPTNLAVGGHGARGTGLRQTGAFNWSGYADTGTGFSSVTGTWTVPKVTGCSATGPATIEVFWVGLDGFSNSTVEQDGTGAACGSGVPLTYFTWWEMEPTNTIQAVGTTVKAGDKISASVVRKGTKYTLKVTDSTTSGNNVRLTQSCSAPGGCANASAEWIAERVAFVSSTGKVKFSPLPDFGTWTLRGATAQAGSKSGTIKSFPDDEVTMFNKQGGHVMARPGALNSKGNSFKDVWKASS